MDNEAWDAIVAKYGIPCSPACCNSGWHAILDSMLARMKEAGFKGEIDDIKQKFGGLRVSVAGWKPDATEEDEAILAKCHEIVRETEANSFNVCEVCGAPGKQRGNAYWNAYALCDDHAGEKT